MPESVVVVSDLHLGAPSSLMAFEEVQGAFVEQLSKLKPITALVLLGDILDLTRAPLTAWSTAAEFFRRLFGRTEHLWKGTLIHYVPGNHDHHLHALLVENADIINRLQESVLLRNGVPRLPNDLKLAPRVFGPDHPTFFHGLFPDEVRKRLTIWYPFIDRELDGKPFLFHHGHYFDQKFTPLAASIVNDESDEHAMQLIEEQNWAILELAFYLGSIGRSSREFVMGACGKFRRFVDYVTFWRTQSSASKTIGGLPWDYIKTVVKSLYGKSHYTLVFGHTHHYDSHTEKPGELAVFNTGGWIVEENGLRSDTGILHIVNGRCEWKTVGIPDVCIVKAAARAKAVQPRDPRLVRRIVRVVRSLRPRGAGEENEAL